LQNETQNFSKKQKFLRLKIMCLQVSFKNFLASLKKGVGSGSLVRGTDPQIRIPNTGSQHTEHVADPNPTIGLHNFPENANNLTFH
jgi:hypothetical protein